MNLNYSSIQQIQKQLLNQGYNSIIVVNKHEGPEHCFLSKRTVLPDIILDTNYLLVPLADDYALDIIHDHFVTKNFIIRTLPNYELQISTSSNFDNEFLFEISEMRYLHIYKRGRNIDTIDIKKERRNIFDIKPFLEEEFLSKNYFSLPFGYALIHFLQKHLPFEGLDFMELLYNYEREEAKFEYTCFVNGVKYVPNMNLSEKLDCLEGNLCREVKVSEYSFLDDTEYKIQTNLYYKLSQLGFIITNPFGEVYEPIKIDLAL